MTKDLEHEMTLVFQTAIGKSSTLSHQEIGCLASLFVSTIEDTSPGDRDGIAEALQETISSAPNLDSFDLAETVLLVLENKGLLPTIIEHGNSKFLQESGQINNGDECFAILSEDKDWHPAVVKQCAHNNDPDQILVVFREYNKEQTVRISNDEIVKTEDIPDDDSDSNENDACVVCAREMPITLHHVIPRTTHDKYRKLGYSQELLSTTIRVCRPCHSAIHRMADEATLARDFNTLEKIMQTSRMQQWAKYAARLRPVPKGVHFKRYKK
eukprot:c18151_g1_i1.p1 GENE.c18151_g1_i1~~c18151_g1_i1.p1  ORF type:complete len:314 (+),score=80.58 c18151_g1_i1:135-944(+)